MEVVLETLSTTRLRPWAWRSLVPSTAQPLSSREWWEAACRFSAALKCLQSELAQHLLRAARLPCAGRPARTGPHSGWERCEFVPPVPLPCLQPQGGGWRGWKHLHIPVSWVQGVLSALPALSKAWAVAPCCPPAPTSLFPGVWWQPGKPGTSGSRTTSAGDG